MRMQITVENLTTTKALAILSALETAEALHETDLDVSVLPVSRSERDVFTDFATAADAVITASAVDVTNVTNVTDVTDVTGIVEEAVAEQPEQPEQVEQKRHGKYPGYMPRRIVGVPILGRPVRTRLIPLAIAQATLGWKPGRLDYMVATGAIETVVEYHGLVRYHFLTPEQLAVLRVAERLAEAREKKRFSRSLLRRATAIWQQSQTVAA